MTASMTAFCRTQTEFQGRSLIWEVRSVNHRYLDAHLKLPDELKVIETRCRTLINERVNRGRIDALLKYEAGKGETLEMEINDGALEALASALQSVESRMPNVTSPHSLDVLRWQGILKQPEANEDALTKAAQDGLSEALDGLVIARNREGERLAQMILDRIDDSRVIVSSLRDALPDIELGLKQRWNRRLEELGDEIDPARLSQELAILLTRSDVSEELDRLETHFDEVQRVIGQKKPAGRRLDFLMQELNREANTLGSKAVDLRNTNASVELKVLIDQMREQVQNIE
ncbi:MAG: YicC family protein [Acidiferrobacterales bacterium]|nr:YicC family protein [Acidiferrobacterales bacterium]